MKTQDTVSKTHHYLVLDSLRGICACMVILYHAQDLGFLGRSGFIKHSFLFVDFFFVLSGFVIATSYARKLESGFAIRKFMLLRLGRLYPLHLFMLLVYLAFELAFLMGGTADRRPFTDLYSPSILVATIFFVQIFLVKHTGWNGPSWSIAAEFWTYLTFALLFRFLKQRTWIVCIFLPIGCAIYLSVLTDRYLSVVLEGAFARCLFGFSLGVLAYQLRPKVIRWSALSPGTFLALEAIAVALVVGFITYSGAGPWSLAVPPLFFAIVLLFSFEGGLVSGLLLTRPFRLLGTLSFSLYMLHEFVLLRALNVLVKLDHFTASRWHLTANVAGHNQVTAPAAVQAAACVGIFALVIALSYLSYTWVERPGQRWSRRKVLGDRWSTPAARSTGRPGASAAKVVDPMM